MSSSSICRSTSQTRCESRRAPTRVPVQLVAMGSQQHGQSRQVALTARERQPSRRLRLVGERPRRTGCRSWDSPDVYPRRISRIRHVWIDAGELLSFPPPRQVQTSQCAWGNLPTSASRSSCTWGPGRDRYCPSLILRQEALNWRPVRRGPSISTTSRSSSQSTRVKVPRSVAALSTDLQRQSTQSVTQGHPAVDAREQALGRRGVTVALCVTGTFRMHPSSCSGLSLLVAVTANSVAVYPRLAVN